MEERELTQEETAKMFSDIGQQLADVPDATIKDVLDSAKDSENTDVAYIMSSQLNLMYDTNYRLRGNPMFSAKDVQAFFKILTYLLADRPKSSYTPPPKRPMRTSN